MWAWALIGQKDMGNGRAGDGANLQHKLPCANRTYMISSAFSFPPMPHTLFTPPLLPLLLS